MTAETLTAKGSVTHTHAGGLISITSAGSRGGIVPMYTPTGGTKARVLCDENRRNPVNGPAFELAPCEIEVFVNDTSNVSVSNPIEITINSH